MLLPPLDQALAEQQACCQVQQLRLQEALGEAQGGQVGAQGVQGAVARSHLLTATLAAWPHGPCPCQTCFLCCYWYHSTGGLPLFSGGSTPPDTEVCKRIFYLRVFIRTYCCGSPVKDLRLTWPDATRQGPNWTRRLILCSKLFKFKVDYQRV